MRAAPRCCGPEILNALPWRSTSPASRVYRATINDLAAHLMALVAPPPSDIALRVTMFNVVGGARRQGARRHGDEHADVLHRAVRAPAARLRPARGRRRGPGRAARGSSSLHHRGLGRDPRRSRPGDRAASRSPHGPAHRGRASCAGCARASTPTLGRGAAWSFRADMAERFWRVSPGRCSVLRHARRRPRAARAVPALRRGRRRARSAWSTSRSPTCSRIPLTRLPVLGHRRRRRAAARGARRGGQASRSRPRPSRRWSCGGCSRSPDRCCSARCRRPVATRRQRHRRRHRPGRALSLVAHHPSDVGRDGDHCREPEQQREVAGVVAQQDRLDLAAGCPAA